MVEIPSRYVDTAETAQPSPQVFSRGGMIAASDGATLPCRCIHCNAKVTGRPLLQRLRWFDSETRSKHRWAVILVFILPPRLWRWWMNESNRPPRLAKVRLFLCPRHKVLRMLSPMAVLAGIAGMIALFMKAPMQDTTGILIYWLLGAFVPLIVGIVIAMWLQKTLTIHRFDYTMVLLKGACDKFLAELPVDPTSATGTAPPATIKSALLPSEAKRGRYTPPRPSR